MVTNPFTIWLTNLLAGVIRPILHKELKELKTFIAETYKENKQFKEYDLEARDLIEEVALAETLEERDAILDKLYDARARHGL